MDAHQDEQSTFVPTLLLIFGVFGAVYSAIHGHEMAFAVWCVLGAIGAQELRSSNDFNESE